MPKISIVIPAYNVGSYLQECLDSVRNQTLSDIEAIVVNDASTDDVAQIAEAAATQDPRIRVITIGQVVYVRSRGCYWRIHVLP